MKSKGPKQDNQHRLRSGMSGGGEQPTVKFLNELVLCDYKCRCLPTQILTTKKDVNEYKL